MPGRQNNTGTEGRLQTRGIGGFNPISLITGQGGFWRADLGVSLSGSNVTTWADQSPFANTLTGANAPVFGAASFNTSFPGISSSAMATSLTSGSISCASPTFSHFMLLQSTNGNSSAAWAAIVAGGSDQNTPAIVAYSPNTTQWQPFSNSAQGTLITVPNTSVPILVGWVADGSNINTWRNGALNGSPSAFTSTLGSAAAQFVIGNNVTRNANFPFVIAFCGFTQKAMNTTDWTNLKNWSNANWGTAF